MAPSSKVSKRNGKQAQKKKVQFSVATAGAGEGPSGFIPPTEKTDVDDEMEDIDDNRAYNDSQNEHITEIYSNHNANEVLKNFWATPADKKVMDEIADINKLIHSANTKNKTSPATLGSIPSKKLEEVVKNWMPALLKAKKLVKGDKKEFKKACRELEGVHNNFNKYLKRQQLPAGWAPSWPAWALKKEDDGDNGSDNGSNNKANSNDDDSTNGDGDSGDDGSGDDGSGDGSSDDSGSGDGSDDNNSGNGDSDDDDSDSDDDDSDSDGGFTPQKLNKKLERHGFVIDGKVMAWKPFLKTYKACIVRYGDKGGYTYRLVSDSEAPSFDPETTPLLSDKNRRMKAKKGDRAQKYTENDVRRYLAVAYRVKEDDMEDPAACMEPGQERYIETHIWVEWMDGEKSWELRSGMQEIMGKPRLEGDTKIYELARKQEKKYRKSKDIKGFVDYSSPRKATTLRSRGRSGSADRGFVDDDHYVDARGDVFVREGSASDRASVHTFGARSKAGSTTSRASRMSKGSGKSRQSSRRSEVSDPGYDSDDNQSQKRSKKNKGKGKEELSEGQQILKGMSQLTAQFMQTMKAMQAIQQTSSTQPIVPAPPMAAAA